MDIYAEVTNRIMAELETGVIPWQKPWTGTPDGAISHMSGKPYSLLNQLLLGKPGEYVTFKQCAAEGGNVKKGSKARFVVFWKMLKKECVDEYGQTIRDAQGMPKCKVFPVLKYFNVFHIDDCEGIEARYSKDEPLNDVQPIERAQQALDGYLKRSGVTLYSSKSDRAFYRPALDEIHLPLLQQFADAEGYYDTAFHEAVHSTGHKSRLNRFPENMAEAAFGSESYSKEELVAELGACGIMHELGLETRKTFRNNAAYIQGWLGALRNDKRLIVSAASKAEKAVAMILGKPED